jgi:glutamyl-tRNA reductase
MEIYACTPGRAHDSVIYQTISEFCGIPLDEFMPFAYTSSGHKAAEHLFRVAAGIDSMVLGETQILGQIKDAYGAASMQGSTGTMLNTLFQQAATVGKRAQTETCIGHGAFSVGSAAVQLAHSIFEDLNSRTVLVVGAGKMAKTTILHLSSAGANRVVVANRTLEKAAELASEVGGRAIGLDDIKPALETADIVITSTGTKDTVIDHDMVASIIRRRRGRPMFFIDIAVPRDVDEAVGGIGNVFLYNIDDLQAVVESGNAERSAEIERVEAIVTEELHKFNCWVGTLDAVPVITALREKFERIRQMEMESLSRKLSHLSSEDLGAIEAATRSIVKRISHQPILQIKDYALTESGTKLEAVCETFGLSPNVNDEV